MKYIGIDGCKAGWFFVASNGSGFTGGIAESVAQIVDGANDDAKIMIDIPIGLPDAQSRSRQCDAEARNRLKPNRASSVFNAPIREILEQPSHAAASGLSKQLIDKGISQQSFAIIPKIREVDNLLAHSEKARNTVREIHPEICFWGLNQQQAMTFRKKEEEGFAQRLKLLESVLPGSIEFATKVINKYPRKHVARDDIADALVALAVAMAKPQELFTLPDNPPFDALGLPMEMVYRGMTTSSSSK